MFFENFFQLWNKRRQILGDSLPDDLEIYPVILVDDDIPHGVHFHPREVGIVFLDRTRNMSVCFPDDFEISEDGVYCFIILLELIKGHPLCVPLNSGNTFQNIVKAYLPVSRRHGWLPLGCFHEILCARLPVSPDPLFWKAILRDKV